MSSHDLLFGQIREDSQVEVALARRVDAKTVVCIASGGETALALVAAGVEHVVAVDFSPAQCAVTELKAVAAKEMSWQEWLSFLGENDATPEHRAAQYRALRSSLSQPARAILDANPHWIAGGIHHAGVVERFYRDFAERLRADGIGDEAWEELFRSTDVASQTERFFSRVDKSRWIRSVSDFLSLENHLRYFPSALFVNSSASSFGEHFCVQFESALSSFSQNDNPYLHQLLYGKWATHRGGQLPEHASQQGFTILQRRLRADALTIVQSSFHEALLEIKSRGILLDAAFASNLFDWAPRELLFNRGLPPAPSLREQALSVSPQGARVVMNVKGQCFQSSPRDFRKHQAPPRTLALQTVDAIASALRSGGVLLHRNLFRSSGLRELRDERFFFDEALSDFLRRSEKSFLYQNVDVAWRTER